MSGDGAPTARLSTLASQSAIYGVGPVVALWGFLAVLAGIPMYVWFVTRERVTGNG